MTTDPVKKTELKEKNDRSIMKIIIILLIGGLAPLFDTTMVNVAIHTLTTSLHTTMSEIQWVITGYLLAMSMTIPVSGWAVSRFGGKQMWLYSLVLFLIGSILSALSWDITSLIIFRIIQGIGAGLIVPILMILSVQTSWGNNLGQVISVMGLPALLAPIFGPVLGGIIVHSLGWHWIFFINIPICIVAIISAWGELPEDTCSDCDQTFDMLGILLLSPALALLLYSISCVSSSGESIRDTILPSLTAGLILLGMFIIHATSARNASLLDISLFKKQTFSVSCIMLFAIGAISAGALLIFPMYFQQVRGADVMSAGLWLIPEGLGMLLTRSRIGILAERIDSRTLVQIGLIITIIGLLPFSFAGPDTSPLLLAMALFLDGIGLGGVLIPVMLSAYQGLAREQIPHASIATRIFQLIGGAFGSTVIAVIIQQQLLIYGTSGILDIVNAYDDTFRWLVGFAMVSILSAFALPVQKDERSNQSGELIPVH